MPNHLGSALRLTAATALAGLAMGCAPLPDDPYDDRYYGHQYPQAPYPTGGYPVAGSGISLYEPRPRYFYSSPGGVPMPYYAPMPRPVWQRGGDEDWRDRREREAYRREAQRRADDRRRADDARREADRQRDASRPPPRLNPDVERYRREEAERDRRRAELHEEDRRRGMAGTRDWR